MVLLQSDKDLDLDVVHRLVREEDIIDPEIHVREANENQEREMNKNDQRIENESERKIIENENDH